MNRGVIEQVGVPEEVYERPQSEFVADFVGAINFFPGTIIEDGGASGTIRVSTGSEVLACTLDGRTSPAMGDRVLLMIRPEKLTVDDGTGRAPGLHQDYSAPVNTVRARVSSHTYCGDHCELGFEGRDFALKAMLPSAISPEVGQEAVIAFSARDLHLLPAGSGSVSCGRVPAAMSEA
jgi:ABC-type Fe3+/spermidine/putrescine transport system ATPase subunit